MPQGCIDPQVRVVQGVTAVAVEPNLHPANRESCDIGSVKPGQGPQGNVPHRFFTAVRRVRVI
jgi:hypothetical protein